VSFSLSRTINPPTVFLVRRSRLRGRLDVEYNFALLTTRIVSKYPQVKIRELASSKTGGTPSKSRPDYWKGEIPWASPKDFGSFYLTQTEDHISEDAVLDSTTALVPPGTLLIVFRSGILQHSLPVTITTKQTAINQDLKGFMFGSNVSAEYVGAYFVVFGERLLPLITKSGATVQSINTEQFEHIEIPIPPKDVQGKIVNRLLSAQRSKHEKEDAARRLLHGIDDILIAELGIKRGADRSSLLENQIFRTRFSDITGDRFDPEIVLFRRRSHSFGFPVRRLSELFSESPQYGAGERGIDRESTEDPRYIRITDIDEWGVLSNELGATAATFEDSYLLQDDDLLIARSGNTVGKAYLHKAALQPYACFYAGYMIRFRFNRTAVLPDYVFGLTQSSYYKAWVRAVQRAAGQPNINAQEYSSFQIPLPPISVQEVIVARMHSIRAEAQELLRNAAAELESVKKSIEVLVLGNSGVS